eukprot:6206956-Pleurochrysis_carterae.AAC.1
MHVAGPHAGAAGRGGATRATTCARVARGSAAALLLLLVVQLYHLHQPVVPTHRPATTNSWRQAEAYAPQLLPASHASVFVSSEQSLVNVRAIHTHRADEEQPASSRLPVKSHTDNGARTQSSAPETDQAHLLVGVGSKVRDVSTSGDVHTGHAASSAAPQRANSGANSSESSREQALSTKHPESTPADATAPDTVLTLTSPQARSQRAFSWERRHNLAVTGQPRLIYLSARRLADRTTCDLIERWMNGRRAWSTQY